MNDREENIQQMPVPINTEFDFNFGNYSFDIRRMSEAIIIGGILGFIGFVIVTKFNPSVGTGFTIVVMLAAAGGFLGLKGINGDNVSTYLLNIVRFMRNRRICHYNPRVRSEARYFTEDTSEEDYVIPRERLEAMYRKYVAKSDASSARNNLQEEIFDNETMFFEDDIELFGKPEALMSKAELRKYKRKQKREEKRKLRQQRKIDRQAKSLKNRMRFGK